MDWAGLGHSLSSTGEHGKAVATRADLSPPCLGTCQLMHTPHEWSLGFSRLSICPCNSVSSQGGFSPTCRSPELGCPVCGLTNPSPGVSVHLCDLPFPLSHLPGAQVLTWCFSSHPTWLCVYFFIIVLVAYVRFCQFPVCFPYKCIFDVFVGTGELHVLLLCHPDLLSL